MNTKQKLSATVAVIMLILRGCGEGGGSLDATNADSVVNSPSVNPLAQLNQALGGE